MKVPIRKSHIYLILSVTVLIFAVLKAYALDEGVIRRIREAVLPLKGEDSTGLIISLPEDAVLVNGQYQEREFWTETRKDKIERFKCSGCHNNEKVTVTSAAEMTHGDIKLVHGSADKPLNCYTCHNKKDRDFLVSENNLRIDMDHSYEMCGKCHFRQKKDWAGGAHGKRITYWAGKRQIMNCTSCHDPHSPRFKKRWPKTYSPPDAK